MESPGASTSPLKNNVWMWTAAGVVVITAAQTGFILYLCKKCATLKAQLQRVSNECINLGQEIRELRVTVQDIKHGESSRHNSRPFPNNYPSKRQAGSNASIRLEDVERGTTTYESRQPSTLSPQHGSSSGSSDYMDAADDWTTPLLIMNPSISSSDTHSPAQGHTSPAALAPGTSALFEHIDALHQRGENELAYEELKKLHADFAFNESEQEVLWRLARVCRLMASSLNAKDQQKKKDLLFEGQAYALKAYELDDTNFTVVKWTAVMAGALTDYLGTKERIEQGILFKQYLDKALNMDPNEYSLLHMRGRFAFSVASLSWLERKAAAAFFAAPPTATFEEAIADFLRVEELRPQQWIENLLFLAKCYLATKDKAKAITYLEVTTRIEPIDDADKEAKREAQSLLQKHSK